MARQKPTLDDLRFQRLVDAYTVVSEALAKRQPRRWSATRL